jgi:hypothetical protein
MLGQESRASGQGNKYRLRDFLGRGPVVQLPEGGAVNEVHVALDQLAEGGFGTFAEVLPQQLLVLEIVRHFTHQLPPSGENRKEFHGCDCQDSRRRGINQALGEGKTRTREDGKTGKQAPGW